MEAFSLDIPEIKKEVETTLNEEKSELPHEQIKSQADNNTISIFTIDLDNFNEREEIIKPIENFGIPEMKRSTAKNALIERRVKDIKEGGKEAENIGDKMALLDRQIKDLDPKKVNFASKGLFGKIGNPVKRYFQKYEKADAIIDNILNSLDESSRTLQNDNVTLNAEEKSLREVTQKLNGSIELGQQMDASIESQILEAEINGTEPEKIAFVRQEVLFPLRQRVMDMQQMVVVNQQGIISLNVIRRNNRELIRGIERAKTVTVTALRTGVMAASALYNQKVAMDKIKVLNATTENIIESTSQILREQGGEIQKMSAETMISPEVLKNAFTEAIAAIEDVSNYKEQSLGQMKETINAFSEMAIEGQKIVEKIKTTNNN